MTLDSLLDQLADALSGARAKAVVAEISRHHRIQGSPGFLEAAQVVQGALEGLGLGTALHAYPADGRTRTFAWTAPLSWSIRSGCLHQVAPAARLLVDFSEVSQGILAHSLGGQAEAGLVHVGAGTSEEDFAAADVAGCYVLASGRPQDVAALAVPRGAVGVVYYPSSEKASTSADLIQYAGFWPNADDVERTPLGFSVSRRQADLLLGDLRRGPVRLRGHIDADLGPGQLHVLEAWIPGTRPEAREVFLVAHLCHPRPSANDNASGSGLLVEIARAIVTLAEKAPQVPERTVRFLFVPEFYGTLPWAASHHETASRALYVLNLDMVGQSPEKLGEPFRVWRAPGRLASPLDAWLVPLLERIGDDPRGVAPGGSRRPMTWRVEPPGGGSDHLIFADPLFAAPAVMFGHGDPLHHTHLDDLEMVCPTELKRVGLLAASLALLPGLLHEEARRLTAWLIEHGVRALARAAQTRDDATRAERVRLALAREERRLDAFSGLLEEAGLPRLGLEPRRALTAARDALLPPGHPSPEGSPRVSRGVAVPRKAFQGPLPYDAYRRLPRDDRRFLEEQFSGPYGILPIELANLADGTRDKKEIALLLSLEFEREIDETVVARAVIILERAGWLSGR